MTTPVEDAWAVFYDALVHRGETSRKALADFEATVGAADAAVMAAADKVQALIGQVPASGGIIPGDANQVKVGPATFPLAAVNPTAASNPPGAGFPGFRGKDQLVAYQSPVAVPATNPFGRECVVVSGRATGPTVANVGTVPADGCVLSGHGMAGAWLDATVKAGAVVEVSRVDRPPTPSPTGRTIGVYQMMYGPSNGSVAAIGGPVNEIRGAFLLGSGLSFPGWAADGKTAFVAAVKAWRATGRRWVPSIGGGGNPVDISNPSKVVSALKVLADMGIPPDDIDIDVEASGVGVSPVLAMAEAVHSAYGCLIDMTPNGSNVGAYLPISVELQKAGLLRMHAHQFYDSNVPLGTPNTTSRGTAFGRLNEALAAGIRPERLGVAVMLPEPGDNPANYWDRATCVANMKAIVKAIPGIGGVVAWERSRPGTLAMLADVAAVLGM